MQSPHVHYETQAKIKVEEMSSKVEEMSQSQPTPSTTNTATTPVTATMPVLSDTALGGSLPPLDFARASAARSALLAESEHAGGDLQSLSFAEGLGNLPGSEYLDSSDDEPVNYGQKAVARTEKSVFEDSSDDDEQPLSKRGKVRISHMSHLHKPLTHTCINLPAPVHKLPQRPCISRPAPLHKPPCARALTACYACTGDACTGSSNQAKAKAKGKASTKASRS